MKLVIAKRAGLTGMLLLLVLTVACQKDPKDTGADESESPAVEAEPEPPEPEVDPDPTCTAPPPPVVDDGHVVVCVTLDGEPSPATVVMQGGAHEPAHTDDDGYALVPIKGLRDQTNTVVASHPEARIKALSVLPSYDGETLHIVLKRFSRADNLRYTFQDPGAPGDSPSTAQCGHCHLSQTESWYSSVHRGSVSNPWVQQLYAGTTYSFDNEQACEQAGGKWLVGLIPGTTTTAPRCYLGHGTLPALNENCGDTHSCDTEATAFGGCADCHAPGINGVVGGRDLLDATGIAFEDGVHCDTCHRVESVNLDAVEAGVAGKLNILRPSEPAITSSFGEFSPLMFGPRHDVPNPRMGSVQRDHFSNGQLCAGCHEYDQPVLVSGGSIDVGRWPEQRLPVHSTWSEWEQGPLGPDVSCEQCHMPPNSGAANSIDVEGYENAYEGSTFGFLRVPGTVRHHKWVGPRQVGSRMLELAAALVIEKEMVEGEVHASVTVKHVGPGHALPTGEPMRSMVLTVEARCGEDALRPSGGHVIPDFGGYEEVRAGDLATDAWPDAQVGDVLRVVRKSGSYHDYRGFGPFGNGQFNAAQKGMPEELWVGSATVTALDSSGIPTLSNDLPSGDVVYRIRPSTAGTADQVAGKPGFGFARVMVGPDGERMVPHFMAVDIASDNRLLPFDAWTSSHRFTTSCEEPVVKATLRYRPIAFNVAKAKHANWTDVIMVEAQR